MTSHSKLEYDEAVVPRSWHVSIMCAVAVGGLLVKSTLLSVLTVGASGFLAGVPLAIWLVSALLLVSVGGDTVRKTFILVVATTLTFVLYGDLLHIRAFGSPADLVSIAKSPTVSGLGDSIRNLMRPWDVLFFLDSAGILLFGVLEKDKAIVVAAPRRRFSFAVGLVSVVFLVSSAVQATKIPVSPDHYLAGNGPVGVHVNQILSSLPRSNYTLSGDERMAVESWLENNSDYSKSSAESERLFGALDGRDIYLIFVESLEGVVLGLEVEGQEITPHMNAISKESLVFSNVTEQTRDGVTSDAELILLTGLYPLQSGSAFLKYPDATYPVSLPRLLGERGYSTLALNGDHKRFWNRHVMFPRLGFDKYVAEEEFVSSPQIGMGVADKALFEQAWIERQALESPVFMMISTITSHTPWSMPTRHEGLVLSRTDLTADYLQTLHYVDRQIGGFVDVIEDNELLDQSAFIILGDHEGIHKYNGQDTWLADNEGKVPFVVFAPGLDGEVLEAPSGQVDVMPTLVHLFGIEPDEISDQVMGRNIFGEDPGPIGDSIRAGVDLDHQTELVRNPYYISDLILRGDYFAQGKS